MNENTVYQTGILRISDFVHFILKMESNRFNYLYEYDLLEFNIRHQIRNDKNNKIAPSYYAK